MSFIEFLVFIITMIALTILSARRAKIERLRRQEHPEEYAHPEDESQAAMKEFMKALNIDIDEVKEVAPSPPPPPPQSLIQPEPVFRKDWKIEPIVYPEKKTTSRAKEILLKSGSLKDAVVLHEILGKPKGLL